MDWPHGYVPICLNIFFVFPRKGQSLFACGGVRGMMPVTEQLSGGTFSRKGVTTADFVSGDFGSLSGTIRAYNSAIIGGAFRLRQLGREFTVTWESSTDNVNSEKPTLPTGLLFPCH